jgi:hypothetical protein
MQLGLLIGVQGAGCWLPLIKLQHGVVRVLIDGLTVGMACTSIVGPETL